MLTLYHGGTLEEPGKSLWATPDRDYASAFAQLHEGNLWALSVDVDATEILDLTTCGLDVRAVADALVAVGVPASIEPGDEHLPHCVVRRAGHAAIRAAGYRAVRVSEWIDCCAGERHAESIFIADMATILRRERLIMPDRNFQLPDEPEQEPYRVDLPPVPSAGGDSRVRDRWFNDGVP